jgi:hypothetical protein
VPDAELYYEVRGAGAVLVALKLWEATKERAKADQ